MNRYRLRSDGTIKTEHEIRESFNGFLPAVIDAFTCDFLGVDPVLQSPQPVIDDAHELVYGGVVKDALGNWVDSWGTKELPPEQIAANAQRKAETVMKSVVDATQERLDAFAQTRTYDSILSACTYANSSVPRLKKEGQTCVTLRDLTWEALYTHMNAVQRGEKQMPSGFSDIESILPILDWGN